MQKKIRRVEEVLCDERLCRRRVDEVLCHERLCGRKEEEWKKCCVMRGSAEKNKKSGRSVV